MDPLEVDDLMPLEEFAARRRELFATHQRYLDRYRRVRLGPQVTLVFENRQTLWFRVQEVLRIARISEPPRIRQELDLYNRLLPSMGRLQAALLIEIDETRFGQEWAKWQELSGEQLTLRAGEDECSANLLTCRPEDRAIGAAHWVQFVLDEDLRTMLADLRRPAGIRIALPTYIHDTGSLPDDIRLSLAQDLTPSHRAA